MEGINLFYIKYRIWALQKYLHALTPEFANSCPNLNRLVPRHLDTFGMRKYFEFNFHAVYDKIMLQIVILSQAKLLRVWKNAGVRWKSQERSQDNSVNVSR